MNKYRNHINYLLILLLFISPLTLRGDDIVACFNFSEKSVHLELPHNQHVPPEVEDASCSHDHEEHSTTCDTGHKHDACSDIPFAIKVVRRRNNEESLTGLHLPSVVLLFASAQIVTPALPAVTVLKSRTTHTPFNSSLRSTILRC